MNELQTLMQEAVKQNPEAVRDMLRRLSTEERGSEGDEKHTVARNH